jgi:hypothetical protein
MSIEFLVTSLIVVATPGTGVLYTLAAGLSRGSRASVVAAFGCTLGIIPHMAAAILGLAASRRKKERPRERRLAMPRLCSVCTHAERPAIDTAP